MTRRNSEQRNVARRGGQFAPMDACELCGKPGTLEPAFGGDSSAGTADDSAATRDPAWL